MDSLASYSANYFNGLGIIGGLNAVQCDSTHTV